MLRSAINYLLEFPHHFTVAAAFRRGFGLDFRFLELVVNFSLEPILFVGLKAHDHHIAPAILREKNWFAAFVYQAGNIAEIVP